MNYSAEGYALTEKFEGLKLQSYQDLKGVWTIGYGHTGKGVRAGMHITPEQAHVLLKSDLAAAEVCVNHAVKVPLTQGQFDCLVDFVYNEGQGAFLESALLQFINQDRLDLVPDQLRRWIYAGASKVPGLVARREAEIKLWEAA